MEILCPRPGQYLIDQSVRDTKKTAKKLKMFGGNLTTMWASAHDGIDGNKLVDLHAKMAAEGDGTPAETLPNFLKTFTEADTLLISYSPTKQCF